MKIYNVKCPFRTIKELESLKSENIISVEKCNEILKYLLEKI